MRRVDAQLLRLLLCTVLTGCVSSAEDIITVDPAANLIQFSPMFSAFDDGAHEYAVTPSVSSVEETSSDSDPVIASSVRWEVDPAFVARDEFPELAAAIKLTTKKAGRTQISISAKTLSGVEVRSNTYLIIHRAAQHEWDAGNARYTFYPENGWRRSWAADDERLCGLDTDVDLPPLVTCGHCHNAEGSMFGLEHTPTQTAGYSDEDLISIFTTGAKPAGQGFNSPFLRSAAMPDCLYKEFHTWEMTEDEKRGIVWTLRAIPPKVRDTAAL